MDVEWIRFVNHILYFDLIFIQYMNVVGGVQDERVFITSGAAAGLNLFILYLINII